MISFRCEIGEVGEIHRELDDVAQPAACGLRDSPQVLEDAADRAACLAYAERHSWRACAELFLSHLVPLDSAS
jgi:hypothetical protein